MTTTEPKRPSRRDRVRGLSTEVIKFGIVGVSGVLVNFLVFWLCLNVMKMASVRSGILATLVAIGTNYVGYRYWLYKDRDAVSRRREITLFLIFSGIGLLIENGILGFSVYVLGYHSNFAQIIAKNVVGLIAGTVFRFFSYRTWVFKAMPEVEVVEQAEAYLAKAAEPSPEYVWQYR